MFIGNQEIKTNTEPVAGNYCEINGESFYKISNYDKMNPFFMSIVSNSDHWMFISSNGGLTAGRKNPDNALFPYYTDDVIHTSQEITGSKSVLQVERNGKKFIWEPFSDYYKNIYNIRRNLYKNIPGNKIIFEENNLDLGLSFLYTWMNSEAYGFVKKSELRNNNKNNVKINLIDGIQNILPYGVYQQFQNEFSTLIDGYKKNELIEEFGIGIFSLSSIPSDKAEPSESLKTTTVWSTGIEVENYLLSSRQLTEFRLGNEIINETDIRAAKGAYFINSIFSLNGEEVKDWLIVSEINQDLTNITKIQNLLRKKSEIKAVIENDVEAGTNNLIKIVASADGLQLTNNKLATSRHFSNVLFNTMRGGIFDDSYVIHKSDFLLFLNAANLKLIQKNSEFIKTIDEVIKYGDLKAKIESHGDRELLKLSLEYLPITFSRRHGDPSRPWNRFSIDIKNHKNEKVLNYQGNWRDLFQNWEALAQSYPEYLESMITKFLNASTADGYNPYRVTRDGFDWEAPEADMPWANIGYWGDHQIIYLLKLLELSVKFNSSLLKSRIASEIYCYANVPYRIKNYSDLLEDAQNTIDFDHELHNEIIENEKVNGSDARFIFSETGSLLQVNLAEKLLVTLLSKLSNFIPDAGIWMNTQRPEWNDANNALVGNGVSMVTLYHIRRYVVFCFELFSKLDFTSISFSEEVGEMFEEINSTLNKYKDHLNGKISDKLRKTILDSLGIAGENYRNKIYKNGFSSIKKNISPESILEFLDLVKVYTEHTINSNKRVDGLYHSYNVITISKDEIKITNLYEMLEGQVAVLSSGYLSAKESIQILAALRKSSLYRENQNSYILYPDRQLPIFINKNVIWSSEFNSSKLLLKLIEIGNDDIVIKDDNGNYHFNGELTNAKVLKSKLDKIDDIGLRKLVEQEEKLVINIYESLFNHKAFTGRSGTFYKYEGLGCIYWHMVSKLVLAVQETYYSAHIGKSTSSELEEIKRYYYDIKEGIGLNKSPMEYGAFPTDPYSHTPSFSGVQQPGMTGQVKEDIISRYGELGLKIDNGVIKIITSLLSENEFLTENKNFSYFKVNNEIKSVIVKEGSLAFTYCQVPFIYSLGENNSLNVIKTNNEILSFEELEIKKGISNSIFSRNGEIDRVEVTIQIS